MGHMETEEMKRTGSVLVLFPALYSVAITAYFAFLTERVKLSDVLPWFFYLYFPVVVISVLFTVISIIHLFRNKAETTLKARILWTLLMLLANPFALPVYRFSRMKPGATLCRTGPSA